jgi:hypothetical protein
MRVLPFSEWPFYPYGVIEEDEEIAWVGVFDLSFQRTIRPILSERLPPKSECALDRCEVHLFAGLDDADAFAIGLGHGLAVTGMVVDVHSHNASKFLVDTVDKIGDGTVRDQHSPYVQFLGADMPDLPFLPEEGQGRALASPGAADAEPCKIYERDGTSFRVFPKMFALVVSYYNCRFDVERRKLVFVDHRDNDFITVSRDDFEAALHSLGHCMQEWEDDDRVFDIDETHSVFTKIGERLSPAIVDQQYAAGAQTREADHV